MTAPIAVALDAPDPLTLTRWASAVAGVVSTVKIGLEVYLRDGATAVTSVRDVVGPDCGVFLDLKLHDIPATVGGAARSVRDLRPDYLTVHASGGPEMVSAAVSALPDTRITAVTVLTSLGDEDLRRLGLVEGDTTVADIVQRWAHIAVDAGARALVCSPQEVALLRASVPDDITLITPGVRPSGADAADQRRVATPSSALADGADLLVVGRPITASADPHAAAVSIAEECHAALLRRSL